MVSKQRQIVSDYLIVDLADFLGLISSAAGDLPDDVALDIQQMNRDGAHGPKMRLSKNSVMKVMVVDLEQDKIQKTIDKNRSQLGALKVTDIGNGEIQVTDK